MRNPKLFLFLALFLVLSACERPADLENTDEYSRDGISFSLPGNWEVTEDVEDAGFRYLFVETPGGAIIVISAFPTEFSSSLLEHVEWTIQHAIDEMPIGKRSEGSVMEIQNTISDQAYSGYKNEFAISLAGFNVPHIAEFYRFTTNTKHAFIQFQVSIEDLSKVRGGFDLVLSTFKLV